MISLCILEIDPLRFHRHESLIATPWQGNPRAFLFPVRGAPSRLGHSLFQRVQRHVCTNSCERNDEFSQISHRLVKRLLRYCDIIQNMTSNQVGIDRKVQSRKIPSCESHKNARPHTDSCPFVSFHEHDSQCRIKTVCFARFQAQFRCCDSDGRKKWRRRAITAPVVN